MPSAKNTRRTNVYVAPMPVMVRMSRCFSIIINVSEAMMLEGTDEFDEGEHREREPLLGGVGTVHQRVLFIT
ncbi:MAG: hypothetical protein IPO90_16040 [Flavobacteriales bacterium]|nr:hypothetical protein [Flavobacteriales bacterium]